MKLNCGNIFWKFNKLPFVYRALKSPNNDDDIPNFLPFKLYIDNNTGTLKQYPDKEIKNILDRVYKIGYMIPGNAVEDPNGEEYTNIFIENLCKYLNVGSFCSCNILDIGCGNGYLLYRLKILGANVLGLEPGLYRQIGAKKYNVSIIQDSFPSNKLKKYQKFDFIILKDVIEHFYNPDNFLGDITYLLKQDGKLIISVVDAEPYMQQGDISIFFHEHFSYFTEDTLYNTLRRCGFTNIQIYKPLFNKSLFAISSLINNKKTKKMNINNCVRLAHKYKEKSIYFKKKLSEYVNDYLNRDEYLGIYVPGRAINILIYGNIPLNHIRFFDDNDKLKGTFFPGINIPIENRQDLIKKPTKKLLIFSRSFARKLVGELKKDIDEEVSIITLSELFKET